MPGPARTTITSPRCKVPLVFLGVEFDGAGEGCGNVPGEDQSDDGKVQISFAILRHVSLVSALPPQSYSYR